MSNLKTLIVPSLDRMFGMTGLEKELLHEALLKMGNSFVTHGKELWTPLKPTTGYCYVVSELIYHYFSPPGTTPYNLKDESSSHWFLVFPGNTVVDLTMDQFTTPCNYSAGKKRPFTTRVPSQRTKILAQLIGVKE